MNPHPESLVSGVSLTMSQWRTVRGRWCDPYPVQIVSEDLAKPYQVHKDSKAEAGHIFSHAVPMSVYCVILAIPGLSFCCVLFCITHHSSCVELSLSMCSVIVPISESCWGGVGLLVCCGPSGRLLPASVGETVLAWGVGQPPFGRIKGACPAPFN